MYQTPGKDGETRAERHERFGAEVPEWEVPEHGQYLLNWFDACSEGVNRIVDGRAMRITWADLRGWIELTRTVVHPHEIAILKSIDIAYCEALNGELAYAQALAKEQAEAGAG